MARQTIFVVQSYQRDLAGFLVADRLVTARDADDAKLKALSLKDRRAGVVAFSRTGDADLGEYDDTVVLAKYGDIPIEDA